MPVSLDATRRASGDRSVNRTECCHFNLRYRVDSLAMSAWVICIIVSLELESGANQLLRWCADLNRHCIVVQAQSPKLIRGFLPLVPIMMKLRH